ncbi:MAG TPA: CHAD domain-containing protein [Steroidobacteraceae bacterium]|nr:CHAD domain-containing protein [Steroidobacteraceae bacterium]
MPPRPVRANPTAKDAGAPGTDAREVEWQLAATDLGSVRRWLGRHATLDGLKIEPLPAQELRDTYLDTADWRIFRAGFALRLRGNGGEVEATLKSLRSARDDVADRQEITEPLRGDDPQALTRTEGPVGRRVRAAAGREPLRPLFEVRTSRRRYAVRGRSSPAAVGEISLDETRFARPNGGNRGKVLRRVEIEAADGASARLERLAERLRKGCGLQRSTENKFAAGLRTAALAPPPLAGRPRPEAPAGQSETSPEDGAAERGSGQAKPPLLLSSFDHAGDFAVAALKRLASEWQAHEPAARRGESPETLHALRVTARRMDSVLSLFRPYLPAVLNRARPKLKSVLDTMGGVRDLDILLALANSFRDTLPESERPALGPLLRRLESERTQARSRMLHALDDEATRRMLRTLSGEHVRASASRTASRSPESAAAPNEVVPELIHERFRKLRKRARRLSPDSPMSEYHKVRVRAKKLRYAIEVVAPTYARPADEMLAALRKLQNVLGTQHDSDAAARYLSRLADHPPADFNGDTLFVMGKMAQLHARKAAGLAGKAGKPWRKVRGKRWKALRSRMKE